MKFGVARAFFAVCAIVGCVRAASAQAPKATRTVGAGVPIKVTSDTAQFFYDQGAIEFQGNVHLRKVDFRFEGSVAPGAEKTADGDVAFTSDVKGERTDLDLHAERVTIFLDQARLERMFDRQKSGDRKARKAKGADEAVAKRREQIEMLTSLVADGGVTMTNRTVACTRSAADGTALMRAAVAGEAPAFPADAAEKAVQSGESAKVVYFGDTSKVVLYGDEKAPATLRDTESKSELEGGKITCWLDVSVEGVSGKGGARKVITGVKLKQALVEKSVITIQSGAGKGLGEGLK